MTHYEILGIKNTATNDEIKTAYKKLVKKYHPDVYVGDKAFAEKKIKEINEAYDVLSDPEQKKDYDNLINPQTTTSYTPPDYSGYTYNPSGSFYSATSTSKRKADAQGSKYSYENYKKNYNTQGSYAYQRRYTDYHRSKTPNSNYSDNYKNSSDFSNDVSNIFAGFSNTSKLSMLLLIGIFFIIFFIVNIFQITSILNKNSNSSNYSSNHDYTSNTVSQVITEEQQNYNIVNPYLVPENEENNENSSNSQSSNSDFPTLEEFDINDIFSDTEIMQAYQEYGTSSFSSFEDFKEALRITYYQVYILPLLHSY